MSAEPRFFETGAAFYAWLEEHHASATELVVGFHKRGTGEPSLTWPESVDAALCFGWIDGVRRGLDEGTYTIRFTPRRPGSIWSAINVAKMAALEADGRMRDAGRAAFARRQASKTGVYSFERREAAVLSEGEERALRKNAKASAWLDAQAPWYRRAATHWVISPKRPETRASRFAQLLEASAAGRPVKPLDRSRLPSAAKAKPKPKAKPTRAARTKR